MIGGIGTGKSTFVSELSQKRGIKSISADEIQESNKQLSDSDVDEITFKAIDSCLKNHESFIVDGKNINARNRVGLIDKCKKQGYIVYGYDFGKGDITSLIKRKSEPRRFSEEYWEEVYQSDSKSFGTPDPDEGFDKIFYPPK